MAIDGLYISGYFTDDDRPMLNTYAETLREKGIHFSVRNLSGTIMQSAVDFMDISVKVTRKKDDQKLNLTWSSFISPVTQSVVGNHLQTTESAHPFRIEADSIMSAFTEFGDSFDSFGKTFRTNTAALFKQIPGLRSANSTYEEAMKQYRASADYAAARSRLEKEFFWEIGKYNLEIIAEYGKTNKAFHYQISVDEHEHQRLTENIDEALLSPLKSVYGVVWDYHAAYVELHTTEK